MTPLLKWLGGKARLTNTIWEVLQVGLTSPPTTYLEPFFGSGSVFVCRPPEVPPLRAVVSDTNTRLIHFHRTVQERLPEFLEVLAVYREIDRTRYAEVRRAFNQGAPDVEQAVRLLWLNKMGFNGLYRENRRGDYNVPVGTGGSLPTDAAVRAVSLQLQGATILNLSFQDLLGNAGPGSAVYLDPPYRQRSAKGFVAYSAGGFGWDDHVQLRAGIDEAVYNGVRVVLSGSAGPETDEVYLGGGSPLRVERRIAVPRSIGAGSSTRVKAEEYLLVGGGW